MRYSLILSLLISSLILTFSSCEKDSEPVGNSTSTGTLTIYLTDASVATFDSVNITFSQVSAHLDSEWITVQGDTITANMLDLNNGTTIEFGSADVPAGKYTQIRIKIDDAYVVVDSQRHDMTVPSGAQTGLKLGPQFTVAEGSTYELVVDFDVNRSVIVSPQGYKLKPHLRVMPVAISGSISGVVTNPDSIPTAYAIQDTGTVTTSLVNPIDGFFKLAFLPAGFYTVSIRDTVDRTATIDSVEVVAGADKDLGTIELQ